MSYNINALEFFVDQVKKLDRKSRRIIHEKIQLIKENPYRYKKIHSKSFSRVFRVRLTIQSKETRLIYAIVAPNIILVCLLEGKKDYSDLERFLKKINP